jgi:hypothetical protein
MEEVINLSPLAEITCSDKFYSLPAMATLRTKFSSLRHCHEVGGYRYSESQSLFRGQSGDEIFKSKMRVLTKNPVIFHQFQDLLAEAQEQSHSKEGVSMLLHDFLDNYLRMPELRDKINRMEGEELPSLQRGQETRTRLGILASYLGGDSSSPSHPGRVQDASESKKEYNETSSGKPLLVDFPNVGPPSIDPTENSSSDEDEIYYDDDSSSASF